MNELLALVPPINRARDFHLYTPGKKRLLDLGRQDGRAFLGYRPAHWTLELKNQLSRGGIFGLPNPWQSRLEKLLRVSFPGWKGMRCFDHAEDLFRFTGQRVWSDPALGQEGDWCIHRPGLPVSEGVRGLWLRLPDGGLGPEILLSRETLEPGAPISPFRLAASQGALVALNRWEKNPTPQWKEWDLPWFSRRGPYLEVPEGSLRFKDCLQSGFLTPPQDGLPWILPLTWSLGEVRLWKDLSGRAGWT